MCVVKVFEVKWVFFNIKEQVNIKFAKPPWKTVRRDIWLRLSLRNKARILLKKEDTIKVLRNDYYKLNLYYYK